MNRQSIELSRRQNWANGFRLRGMRRIAQRGLTMVEILVAMVLMVMVTLATVTLYSVNSQSYRTVDASQELNDSARYAFELIGQALRIAGYQEYMSKYKEEMARAGDIYAIPCLYATQPCPVLGYNNSTIPDASIATANYSGATDSGGVNFSDTLAVTFAGSSLRSDISLADGSVVDCQGIAQPAPTSKTDLGLSLFWVRTVNGEPELSCISRGANSTAVRTSEPVIRGVESFQVMYGIDENGTDNNPSTLTPDRWVSAQSVIDTIGWTRVRAVRVGFVLRGPPGSAQRPTGTTALTTAERTYYPLGEAFTGTSAEAGLKFVAPDDGRLRRAYSTTFMLRNGF